VHFSARGDALWWVDEVDGSLRVVPLAPGLALERDDDGSMIPLAEPGGFSWALGSPDAPILLVNLGDGGGALLRYPDDPRDALALTREAIDPTATLPPGLVLASDCESLEKCASTVSLSPMGERAIYKVAGGWDELDASADPPSAPLVLPEALLPPNGNGANLVQVLDRRHSAWVRPGQLLHWDEATGAVDSVPVFATPPYYWFSADHGHAGVLLATSGPMYRVDADGIEVVTLETTVCNPAPGSQPVVSPSGRWAGWTCLDADGEIDAASGVVVRASATGLERHVGVPMSALAIDDDGDLLIYSIESIFTDEVDQVAPTSRPRSLFSLSNGGVLSRIDELEPAPAPVLLGSSDLATYIQGRPLD
jgi:hypothetical protein